RPSRARTRPAGTRSLAASSSSVREAAAPQSMRSVSAWAHELGVDARAIIGVQAARAIAYGLVSLLIGESLAHRGLSSTAVGAVLAALLAGIALVSVLLARYGDRVGRRRTYRLLLLAMAAAGTVFALTSWLPALILAALTGTVSTDVVESGPFTSLEQAMLPHTAPDATRIFGTYNTVATLAGSAGALIAIAGSS